MDGQAHRLAKQRRQVRGTEVGHFSEGAKCKGSVEVILDVREKLSESGARHAPLDRVGRERARAVAGQQVQSQGSAQAVDEETAVRATTFDFSLQRPTDVLDLRIARKE